MPSLSPYKSDLDYAYAPGVFPSMECLLHRPGEVRRLLLHSKAEGTEGAEKLTRLAEQLHVRVEVADKALGRVSGKENCFAAAVFSKFEDDLHPDVALIRPCVDIFDPRVVRASMGSLFSLRVHVYDDFEAYRAAYPAHGLYPFMLDGSSSLPDVLAGEIVQPYALIFGNEGSGLPASFTALGQPVRIPSNDRVDSLNLSIAAAIGIYGFTQKEAAHGAA